MRCRRIILAITLVMAVFVMGTHPPIRAQADPPPEPSVLSSYWRPEISRWETIILPYAQQRNLDPDLIAAIIWKESLGRATASGPAGAVGLMGLMPFAWRPSVEELENPWTNVEWGARALAHTIRDGKGDVFYALAAYNGGWDKTHLRSTRNYAADVLSHYAQAIAARHELSADDNWVAIFATQGVPSHRTITVVGPNRPLTRYTERPWLQAKLPTVPQGVAPHATLLIFVDEYGRQAQVNVWLVGENGDPLQRLEKAVTSDPFPSPIGLGSGGEYTVFRPTPTPPSPPSGSASAPTDTRTAIVSATGADLRPGADTWWHPRETLPDGTTVEIVGYDPSFPEWAYIRTIDGASSGWALLADLETSQDWRTVPLITPVPTLTPMPSAPPTTPTPTATLTTTLDLTPTVSCAGGPLQIDAWHLERRYDPGGGWTATIFVQGHGGDCLYTYAWEGEIKGGPMPGSLTFEIHSSDREGKIIGTVSVTSAGETVKTGLFINSSFHD
ncbi:MAG TPA: hypothetical protein ENN99_05735 [Chloroflexi bacterium]|nr:hypothetical protein [Chloroflexota bacterium]